MKVKESFKNETLSDLKRLEEEHEEMMYYNNFPTDMSIVAEKWMQKYFSRRTNNGG